MNSLPASDVADRCARLAQLAVTRDLDGILVHSWRRGAVGWFTGYDPGFVTNQATLWIPASGAPCLGVRFPFEAGRAAAASQLDVSPGAGPTDLVPSDARRIGIVGGDIAIDELSWGAIDALRRRGTAVEDLRSIIDEWRALKSPLEIEALRAAAVIGSDSLAGIEHGALVGARDFEIAANVEGSARRRGATWCRCLLGIGEGAVVTEAAGALVRPADPVSFEVTLVADGACTHVNTTVSALRRVDVRAAEACRSTRATLLAHMHPGAPVDDVVAAADAHLESLGLLAFKEYDFGHGLGRDTPEHPRLLMGTGMSVAVGMVAAVHVAVRRPDGETAFIGGPVTITDAGAEELVPDAVWAR